MYHMLCAKTSHNTLHIAMYVRTVDIKDVSIELLSVSIYVLPQLSIASWYSNNDTGVIIDPHAVTA